MIRPPAGYPGPARQTTGRPRHGAGAHKVVLRQPKPRPYALSRQVCGSAAHKTAYQAPNRMRSTVSDIPADLRYTAEHEWIHRTGPDTVRLGITDFAQSSLGDVVYVQLPEVGAEVSAGDSFGEVESTKSVSDLYAPMSATVVAVNAELAASPQLINSDPYGQGWLLELRADADTLEQGLGALLDADAYRGILS